MPGKKGARGVRTRRIFNDENTRLKIKTTQIINRLTKHIDGELELSSSQVRAAEILLKKTLPDLQVTALTGTDGEEIKFTITNA